jgi:protein-S-isoprenylcysteine O-methyltransferase Ste14
VPPAAQALGVAGYVACAALIWWCMSANTFLGSWARIQHDRGHTVVRSGPYGYVRHPMYVAIIISLGCIPLILGSWWALLPWALIAVLFVVRTSLEDRMLRDSLPGYGEYAGQVRYRLLPGLW